MKYIISVVVASAAVAIALAAGASGRSTSATTARTLKLVERDAHFKFIDVAPKGGGAKPPSEGDEFVIGGTLTRDSHVVGSSNLVCTITQPGSKGLSTCAGTLIVPGGTITAAGVSFLATNSDKFAITGGTGRYASAKGTIVTSQAKDGSDHVTVHVG